MQLTSATGLLYLNASELSLTQTKQMRTLWYSGAWPRRVQGTTVVPGDWILADSAGAVVIPEGALEEAVTGALSLLQMAIKAREFIKAEDPQKVMSDGSMEA